MSQGSSVPNPSQSSKILARLRTGQSLTPLQALKLYGCNRLAARVLDLRTAGHPIQSRTVTVQTRAGTARVAQYYLPADCVERVL